MEEISPASDISFLSVWYWTAILAFVATFTTCYFVAVRPTLRSEDAAVWKPFWNKIEFIWIGLACLSALGALESSWAPVSTTLANYLEEGVREEIGQSKVASKILLEEYCPKDSADMGFCDLLEEIDAFQDYTNFREMNRILLRVWRSDIQFGNSEVLRRANSELDQSWYNATGMSQDAAYERSRRPYLSSLVGRLILFWPHILAIGIALRLSRARAVFAL